MEQKELLGKLSQAIKTEIESLPDYQSMTVEMVGLDQDSYQYKVKLQGKRRISGSRFIRQNLDIMKSLKIRSMGLGLVNIGGMHRNPFLLYHRIKSQLIVDFFILDKCLSF